MSSYRALLIAMAPSHRTRPRARNGSARWLQAAFPTQLQPLPPTHPSRKPGHGPGWWGGQGAQAPGRSAFPAAPTAAHNES